MPGEAASVASVLPAGSTAVARSVGKGTAGILALAMLAVGKADGKRANDVRNTTFHFCFLNTAMHA